MYLPIPELTMKHVSVCLFLFIAASLAASAQRDDGTSMQPIISRANAVVELLEKKSYEVVRLEMDIVTDEKATIRTLYDQWTYGAVAVADDRVEDLDIYVYKEVDGEWVQVKKDDTDDATPLVTIKPSSSSVYKFVIKAHKYSEGYSAAHYALVIYHE